MRVALYLAIILSVTLCVSHSTAYAETGSKAPIFLNKIKSVFSRQAENKDVAPLSNNSSSPVSSALKSATNSATTQAQIRASSAAYDFAAQKRAAYLLKKQQQQNNIAADIVNLQRDVQNNAFAAQQFQASSQARQGNQLGINNGSNRVNVPAALQQQQAPQPSAPTRIIIPKTEENDGAPKPIFRNFR